MNVYVKRNTFIAKVAAKFLKEEKMAVTIGNTIYLHNCTTEDFLKNKNWVTHEIAHVHQFKKSGTLLFLMKYLFQSLKNGYYKNKFEAEARASEKNAVMLNDVNFIVL